MSIAIWVSSSNPCPLIVQNLASSLVVKFFLFFLITALSLGNQSNCVTDVQSHTVRVSFSAPYHWFRASLQFLAKVVWTCSLLHLLCYCHHCETSLYVWKNLYKIMGWIKYLTDSKRDTALYYMGHYMGQVSTLLTVLNTVIDR